MTNTYDLIVVGGGPGGYQAAQLAGRAGMRVMLVERSSLGGLCLNAGCIPTKTLLKSAKLYKEFIQANVYGIDVAEVALHIDRVQARKRELIAKLQAGVQTLLARGKVDIVHGEAMVTSSTSVVVNGDTYTAQTLLIATGSTPELTYDNAKSTTQALDIDEIPPTMGIIGGGPISFGLASIMSMMGTAVTIVEPGPIVLPDVDDDIRSGLLAAMSDVTVYTGTDHVEADVIVQNTRRLPNLDAVSDIGLDIDDGIRVDEHMCTNLPGVYAVGDVTGQAMWAHVALREAEVAVRHMIGETDRMRYHAVATPIYTVPEVAYVGLTEAKALEKGYDVEVYRLPMSANGRFLIEQPGESGQSKIVVDRMTGILLGVHLMGGSAAEVIFGLAAMLEDEFRIEDVQELVFAHPTVSEIIKDSL
ncbi:MAG: NAD(P)/FAD-dependent oxidoreductase, partial [Chloroflexota bacterium]